jgi:peptidoglycan/LPS O-acetylase OafA/YrhL
MQDKLVSIQALRGIAALLVLCAHLGLNEANFLNQPVMPPWALTGVYGVDLFFVISGFVMVYVTRHTAHGLTGEPVRFLYARITRIYPPYWVATLGVLVGYGLFSASLSRDSADLNLVTSFLLWPDHDLPVLLVGWTLIHEMYFYFAFALFLLAPRRLLPMALIVWMAGVAAADLAGLGQAAPIWAVVFHPLTAEFVAGGFIGLLVTSGRTRAGAATLGAGVLWWIIAVVMVGSASLEDLPQGWSRVLHFGAPSALIIYGAAALEARGQWPNLRPAAILGDWSYALYLLHLPIVALLARVFARIFPDAGWIASILFLLAAGSVSILAAGLMCRLFERPVLGLTRRLGDTILPPKADRSAQPKPKP